MGYLATSLSWKCNRCGDIHTGKTSLYECKDCGAILCEKQVQVDPFGDEGEHVHLYYGFAENPDELIGGGKTVTIGCGPVYLKTRQVQCGSVADAVEVMA